MHILIAFEVGESPDEGSAYYWFCGNDNGHTYRVDPVPAPEYDWMYCCAPIPAEALLEWPELRAEYDAMWARLPTSIKRQYTHALGAPATG